MKIIHTFYPVLWEKIDKDTLIMMSLSALLSKKHYGNVHLYCDKKTENIVRSIGIPYDTITTDIFDGIDIKTFSVPKIMVYEHQNEPFIHIDLDTFIFNKIDFSDPRKIYCTFFEGDDKMLNFDDIGIGIYNTYILNTFKLKDILDPDFMKYIKFYKIANMSVMGGLNYKLIQMASSYCLDLYKKNSEFFDNDYYNSCIIEQLFITSAVRMFVDTLEIYQNNKIEFHPLFKNIPFGLYKNSDSEYPFTLHSHHEHLDINDEIELFLNSNYNFRGFTHLNGYKGDKKLVFMLQEKLRSGFDIGNDLIKNINQYFPDKREYDILSEKYNNFLLSKKS